MQQPALAVSERHAIMQAIEHLNKVFMPDCGEIFRSGSIACALAEPHAYGDRMPDASTRLCMRASASCWLAHQRARRHEARAGVPAGVQACLCLLIDVDAA